MSGYARDLAYVHEAGFSDYVEGAAPGVLSLLPPAGLIVDIGCGAGRLSARLVQRGNAVLGIDISASMIRMARKRAPGARFRVVSLHEFEIPACDGVVALGETINYSFDGPRSPEAFLTKVAAALRPGGVFVCDFATPDRVPAGGVKQFWREGEDWAILVETTGKGDLLTRRIVTYRRVGTKYRRSEEVHSLRLFPAESILQMVRDAGLRRARIVKRYGDYKLYPGMAAVIATMPVRS